jgi:putative ABC transport system permease protein
MIAATVALGASVATAMAAVVFDISDKVNQELKTYGANIVVLPKDTAVLTDLYDLEGAAGLTTKAALREAEVPAIKTIFWAFNIVEFAPFLTATVPATGAGPDFEAPLIGTWFAHELELPTGEQTQAGVIGLRAWWEVTGGWIADGDTDLAMVGSALAARQGLALGDTVTLGRGATARPIRVAGLFTSGGEEDDAMVVPLATAQALTGRVGQVDKIEVSALTTPDNDLARKAARNPELLSIRDMETWYCTAYVSSIAYQLEEVLTDSVAKPVRQVAESEGAILAKTQLLMVLVAALALAATGLGIANLVTASVMERGPEIGLLKALGAKDSSVVGLILAEMAVVGILGGAVGYGLGLGFAQIVGQTVFGSAISARPIVILVVGFLVALVVLLGSLPSVRALLRLRPAEVLHGR